MRPTVAEKFVIASGIGPDIASIARMNGKETEPYQVFVEGKLPGCMRIIGKLEQAEWKVFDMPVKGHKMTFTAEELEKEYAKYAPADKKEYSKLLVEKLTPALEFASGLKGFRVRHMPDMSDYQFELTLSGQPLTDFAFRGLGWSTVSVKNNHVSFNWVFTLAGLFGMVGEKKSQLAFLKSREGEAVAV